MPRPPQMPSTDVPEHLSPESLRAGWIADAASVAALLRYEVSAPQLRRALLALLDSERIDRDGAGRVPPSGASRSL